MTKPSGKGRPDFAAADAALVADMERLLSEGLSRRRASLVLVDAGKAARLSGGRDSVARRIARRFAWLTRGIPGSARGIPRRAPPESASHNAMSTPTPTPAPASAADLAALQARVEALEARVDAITGEEARDAA